MIICLNHPRTTVVDFETDIDHYCILKTMTEEKKRKEKKKYAHTWYRHECEPVVQMLSMADNVEA
jgi:hypothetical protein